MRWWWRCKGIRSSLEKAARWGVEQENDLLVCGDCQTSFPLHDIVQFIKHKNHTCNKENVEQGCAPSPDDPALDDGDKPTDLSSSKGKKEGGGGEGWPPGVGERGSGTPCSRDGASSVHSVEMLDDSRERERMPLRPKQVVDAEANTTHSAAFRPLEEVKTSFPIFFPSLLSPFFSHLPDSCRQNEEQRNHCQSLVPKAGIAVRKLQQGQNGVVLLGKPKTSGKQILVNVRPGSRNLRILRAVE
ncbi:hypothetical protein BaRGS_00018575 [Batillaria attramentaria]|uniref:BCL-11A-like CCHC zinc finger domain-containing protein n=1 Tax=Batillaria attramentaria TaxID=370345 RepID=A0ABD0KSG0_9CAEN